jgi:hypothetical protein
VGEIVLNSRKAEEIYLLGYSTAVISQKMAFLIKTSVRTSNLTQLKA